MNRYVFLGLLAITLHFSAISHAEESTDDLLRQMEMQNRESQQRIEKSRLEWQQLGQQLENERLRSQAEDAAEEMRTHILQSEIKHKNQIFLGIVFLTISIFLWRVVKKYRKEGFMNEFEKFGIVTILASGLLILLVLMVSGPWVERFDFIQNLMTVLEFNLFKKDEFCRHSCEYFIVFPAKYAVLMLMALATYGFTTYLGITPPFKRKSNNEPEKTPDSATSK